MMQSPVPGPDIFSWFDSLVLWHPAQGSDARYASEHNGRITMKRLLIGSLVGVLLLASVPAMAHEKGRHGPDAKKYYTQHHGQKHTHNAHRHNSAKREKWRHHHSGAYHIKPGTIVRLSPEARIGRIIYDTHVLIGLSRH